MILDLLFVLFSESPRGYIMLYVHIDQRRRGGITSERSDEMDAVKHEDAVINARFSWKSS